MSSFHEDDPLGKSYDAQLLRRLLGYLRPYKAAVGLSFLLIVVMAGLDLVGPYLTKVAIDRYITKGDAYGVTKVAALYLWLFPTTMLNFYPWGLSVNVVKPLSPERTRVTFLSFVRDASLRETGAGGDLDRVEREDEAVVEAVQRGVRSRLAARGRYSPTEEVGVHHFHRLLAATVS